MDDFINIMKSHAGQMDQRAGQPRFAVVSSVDPVNFTAQVTIQPEGVLSGWLPVLSPWVGAGWGIACPPAPGDQVLVLWQEGDADQGVIIGRAWSASDTPPGAPVGELWLLHKSGSTIKLHNDGSIESVAPSWTHTGDLHVSGNVYDGVGSLARLRGHYDQHTHLDSLDGTTSAPTPQD